MAKELFFDLIHSEIKTPIERANIEVYTFDEIGVAEAKCLSNEPFKAIATMCVAKTLGHCDP